MSPLRSSSRRPSPALLPPGGLCQCRARLGLPDLMNSGSTKLSKTMPASSNTAEFQVPVVPRNTPLIRELSFAGRPSAGDARDLYPYYSIRISFPSPALPPRTTLQPPSFCSLAAATSNTGLLTLLYEFRIAPREVWCTDGPATPALLRGRRSKSAANLQKRIGSIPTLLNLRERWRILDRFRDYGQIITLTTPSIETLGNPAAAKELAKLANGGMAALADKYPDQFVGFAGSLPLNM